MQNEMYKLSVSDKDKMFNVDTHILVCEEGASELHVIFASYIGIPEAVTAISVSFLESRLLRFGSSNCTRLTDPYKRLERPIGLGDVGHGVVYNSLVEIDGIESRPDSADFNRAYLIAPDGNIDKVITEHLIERFGLPREWAEDYPQLFAKYILPLKIYHNENFPTWRELRAVKFTGNELLVKELIREALLSKRLTVPLSEVNGVFNPEWNMKDYLLNNASHMARKLEENPARHQLNSNVDPSIADLKRIPFPVQAHMIQAIVNTLEEENPACGGDMGTGKSIIACGVAHVLHQKGRRHGRKRGTAVLLSAPGITLPKWADKEIRGTIPDVQVNIIRNGNDALALLRKIRSGYRPSKLEFTMVGIDRAKLGPEGYFCGLWRRLKIREKYLIGDYAWHCPECYQPLLVKNEAGELTPALWEDAAESAAPTEAEIELARCSNSLLANGLPSEFKVKWRRSKRIYKCSAGLNDEHVSVAKTQDTKLCESVLWRPALRSRGECINNPRVNISQVLKKTKKYFDLYICDEAHQCKAGDSGRGDAFAQMVKASKRTLMLTGTLTNGKSTSIKELLWRTDPKSLLQAGFDHRTGLVEWASRFGKLETIIDVEEGDQGVITRRKRKGNQVKEVPGIAPQLTAHFLLHKSAFIELGNLGLPLVELQEIPVFLDMDERHASSYRGFHNFLYDCCSQISQASKSKGVWSKFNPATLNYADRPDLGARVVINREIITAEPLYEGGKLLHAKERWLVETIQSELAENRRCVIFNHFTGAYGMNERLRDILTSHGIQCEILNEPDTEKRQQRLSELEEREVPVVLCNMKLVEVGLDMMYWPTIIFYQLTYEVTTIRQASRRGWRIGQDRECRVYYPIYNGSQQMKQFMQIMMARGHALMVEGRLDSSELAQFSRDSQSALASDLASCFASSDIADAWTSIAATELEDIEMIKEVSLKDALSKRMEELADETLRLCGVVDIEAFRNIQKDQEDPADLEKSFSQQAIFDFDFSPEGLEKVFPEANIPIIEASTIVVALSNKKKRGRKDPVENQYCWNF
ncbi:helicase-related protein [Paenibacillus tepidiphilus]|uniref:helicase-related protein n=1 Tax=Paenibacillus tepidiphilus TaxID=2608683 RepID=UPI00123A81EE|nr:helicase-related protein [Paenibacillus tepidiphilus]